MAVTRRGYIFGAFLSSVLSVLIIIVAIVTDNWVQSTATDEILAADSYINYGLFVGELELNNLATPTYSSLYMTCLFGINACAVSCKTNPEARQDEVQALADGYYPNPACAAITTVDYTQRLESPAVISAAFYVCFLLLIFVQLMSACAACILAIINATKNPTEPIFGLPGVLWSNVITAVLGATSLLMFGIHWATSGLQDHLAFSYIAIGLFVPGPSLGYSYWILIPALLCSLVNIGLIELRKYLLERDPPPPTIKVENHSDGTIFLY